MKGMQKIKRGAGFQGVLRYVFERQKGKEAGRLLGGNMSGKTIHILTAEFDVSRRLRPDIKKPVWHNSLRLPEGDQLTDDQWVHIADDYMARMGYTDLHPRCYVLHDDDAGQHIHIVASRVGFDGGVYLGRNENLESTRQIALLEKVYGLTITKGREYEPDGSVLMPERKKPKKGEIDKAFRTGVKPVRMQLQDILDEILTRAPMSSSSFCEALESEGVSVMPNVSTTGRLNGFSFGLDGVVFSGSKLGDRYKLASLKRKGITYEQARDHQILADRKATRGERGDAASNREQHSERFGSLSSNIEQSSSSGGSLAAKHVTDDRIGQATETYEEEGRAKLLGFCPDPFPLGGNGGTGRDNRAESHERAAVAIESDSSTGGNLRADMEKCDAARTRENSADRQSLHHESDQIGMNNPENVSAPDSSPDVEIGNSFSGW